MLADSAGPLLEAHDLLALDLDGVVYVGAEAVPHAAGALSKARAAGVEVAFVTNNASRTPDIVAQHLSSLGIETAADDVVTSAQAAARLLRDRLPLGSSVYLIGGAGLDLALREVGLRPITDPHEGADAVVQGYGPEMPWRRVVDGAILVREGLLWVASNLDSTIPTDRGVGPGNGSLVELVRAFSGREPLVAGKPEPPLLHEVVLRHRAQRPLFVGDRLDTDMAGAYNVGWPSLLVRTGVTTLRDVAAAPPEYRPDYIAYDLRGLHAAHQAPRWDVDAWKLGGWRAKVGGSAELVVKGAGSADDWWRCVAQAAWAFLDEHGRPAQVDHLRPPR